MECVPGCQQEWRIRKSILIRPENTIAGKYRWQQNKWQWKKVLDVIVIYFFLKHALVCAMRERWGCDRFPPNQANKIVISVLKTQRIQFPENMDCKRHYNNKMNAWRDRHLPHLRKFNCCKVFYAQQKYIIFAKSMSRISYTVGSLQNENVFTCFLVSLFIKTK